MMNRKHSKQPISRMKIQVIDRISSLPDCLLVDIISRLDSTAESFRTGTLSKRWQDLWLQHPNRIFSYNDVQEHNIDCFFSSVEDSLIRYGQSTLNKFQLHARFLDPMVVASCIRLAIDLNVQELDINLSSTIEGLDFSLPDVAFTCSSLVHLKLFQCDLYNIDVICWKNLKSLSITYGIFGEAMFQDILSGTPVLETLVLLSCSGFQVIDITNDSVKNFVISGELLQLDTLQINAPHIQSLTIKDDFDLTSILLLNTSFVVQAELDYCLSNGFFNMDLQEHHQMCEDLLEGLILSLLHIKELKVGKSSLKVLARLKAKGFICPSNLKVAEEIDSNSSPDQKELLVIFIHHGFIVDGFC